MIFAIFILAVDGIYCIVSTGELVLYCNVSSYSDRALWFLLSCHCRNLSNNNIGGTIPEDLPVTLQNLYVLTLPLKFLKLWLDDGWFLFLAAAAFSQIINSPEASQCHYQNSRAYQPCNSIFLSFRNGTSPQCFILSSLNWLKIRLIPRSLNGNHLDGKLPDAFDSLTGLVNL